MRKVAAIQMCSSMSVDENLNTAAELIATAAENEAIIIVLPEMFPILDQGTAKKNRISEDYGSGKIQDFLSSLAVEHGVWIVGGTIPIKSENPDKVRAACIVYNELGEAIARYDKINLFDVTLSKNEYYRESDTVEPGNQIVVINTPLGKLGIAVCFDIRFPLLFAEMVKQGVEIIAIPAAFTPKTGEAHWQLLARARAVENFSYVIGACQVGTHASGRKTYGHSLVVDPWGTVIDERLEPTPGIVYADIDLKFLDSIRSAIPLGNQNSDREKALSQK